MIKRIKKQLTALTLVSCFFMSISACNIIRIDGTSNQDSSFEQQVTQDSSSEQSFFPDSSSAQTVSISPSSEPGSESSSYYEPSSSQSSSSEEEIPVELQNITVSGSKQSYEYGEDLDVVVVAHYSDGSSTTVNDYEVTGFDSHISGEQAVTITYEGKEYKFNTVIGNPALVSITAATNKESYEYGEDLDVVVVAHYEDGSSVTIDNYKVSGFDSRTPGKQTLSFSYEDKSCTLEVCVKERLNLFPFTKMESFLKMESIETNVPSPVGFDEWTDEIKPEQDGTKYFFATTADEGKSGTDTIADQYATLLENNEWNVSKSGNTFTALKDGGDVQLSFNTNKGVFSFSVAPYCEFPDTRFSGSLIKTKARLYDNEVVIIGNSSKELVVSDFEKDSFATKSHSSENGKFENISKDVWRFTLNKVGDNYTISDVNGRKLGAKGLGQLAWDEGSTEWNILISISSAIIINTNSNYGRLCCNINDGSITTYKSAAASVDLFYPQLFEVFKENIVYPTSIELDGKSNIGVGKTSKLSVNYYPENTNYIDDVTWYSSNEDIAIVSETGTVKGIAAGIATIVARTKTRNNYIETSFEITIDEAALDSWTIMLYICGADLESDNGLASADISEILEVKNKPDDVNIIMETGGTTRWRGSYGIDANALSRYHVEDNALVLDEKLTKENMGKQSTFESFLNWGFQNYPAEKIGVILWNHGGALDGVCFDDSIGTSNSLTNSETSRAFKNTFEANGINKKLEFVAYDACLMQVQDIAEFNSRYFKYMVGSEELESGYGFVYDSWIDDVYAGKDTQTILKANVDSFIAENGGDQTMSYLNLAKFENYYNKFEEMASAIKDTAKNNYSSFKTLLGKVKDFGDYTEGWYTQNGLDAYGTIDGMDFFNKLESDSKYTSFKTKIDAAKEAYSQVIGYSKCGSRAGASNGMSIIAPISIGYSTAETSFTTWRSIFK